MAARDSNQKGFGLIGVPLLIAVVLALAVVGWAVYRHGHKNSTKSDATSSTSQTGAQQTKSSTDQPAQTAPQYLTIKEWGVQIPLSSAVSDAYYVVPTGISNDADGKPSAINFGLASKNTACGTVTGSPTDYNALGSIVRALPTDKDPVSGKLYTQLDPNGATIDGYYYGYADASLKSKSCVSQTTIQDIDAGFAAAVKSAAATTATAN